MEYEPGSASRLRRWLRLTWRERLLFAGACAILVLARPVLKAIPFRRVWQVAGSSAGDSARVASSGATRAEIDEVRRAVARAGARIPGSNCLMRALAGSLLLRFLGLPYRMSIGVRKPAGGEFEAHAWLVSGGEIVTGDLPDLTSYAPLPTGAAIPRLF